jgi:tetratricopeptide (TPR) repeat protein
MRLVIAAAILLMAGGESRAQPGKTAEEAFEKGRKLMASKSYAEACAAFELSQRLDPQYGTQYNLAGCYAAQGKIATAWKLYRELSRGDTNAQRRARSGALAKQLAKRVPKLRIRVAQQEVDGLKVVVGATDVTALVGAEIPFDLGHHVIEAQLTGYRTFREEIDLDAPGQLREVEIAFEREPPPAPPPPPERPAGPEPRGSRGLYGKITIAGGGAVLGFGLFAGWRALVNRDASRELCNAGACPDRPGSEAKVERARLWGNLSTAAVIAGAVAIAGGVYLWRSAPRSSTRASKRLAPEVGPATASLVLSGVF